MRTTERREWPARSRGSKWNLISKSNLENRYNISIGVLTTSHDDQISLNSRHRRVEDDMRPLVKAAMQSSNAVARKARNAESEVKSEKKRQKINNLNGDEATGLPYKSNLSPPPPVAAVSGLTSPRKEFAKHSSSAPRQLNDVAQAPPEFKKLPRGAAAIHGGIGSGHREGVLSMAQKSMMEHEREKVILRYRELKAQRRGGIDSRDRGAAEED
jgi:hypothetical protein